MNASPTTASALRLPAYSETMEDHAAIEQALAPRPGERAVCIASAGDNAFHLALHGVRVLAVDVEPLQIDLCVLKQRAIERLPWSELAELAGAVSVQRERRRALLDRAAGTADLTLLDDERASEAVEREGLIGCGRLAAFVAALRNGLQALVGRAELEILVWGPERAARERVWRERVEMPAVLDFLAAALNQATISDAFVPAAAWPRMAEPRFHLHYHRVLRRLTLEQDPSANFYLHRLWLGRFASPDVLPPYLSRSNHERLRAALPSISWHTADALELLAAEPPASIDLFNLSNVLDWSDDAHHDALWSAADRAASPTARLFLRSFLADRSPPAPIAGRWTRDAALSAAAASDRVGYFSRYELWRRR